MEPSQNHPLPGKASRPLFGRRDWLWALLVVLAAGAVWLCSGLWGGGDELTAVLWVDGQPRLAISLSDPPAETIPLDAYGIQGVLEAEPGRIRFSKMDCPDKICEKTGWLREENQTAVCMPNRASLTILPAGQVPDIS